MAYDYNEAPTQRELIPHTIATLAMHINAGGVGEDGMLTRSEDGRCEMLVCEFTVVDGKYKGRKVFEYWVLAGTTDGHAKAEEINRGRLRAILESALGIKPKDTSPQAIAARNAVSLKQFEGMTFIGEIGVEKGGPKKDGSGNWDDKNVLAGVITPDRNDWHPVEQPPPFNGGSGGAQTAPPSSVAPPVTRPDWAAS
jgi:hypothetical protein